MWHGRSSRCAVWAHICVAKTIQVVYPFILHKHITKLPQYREAWGLTWIRRLGAAHAPEKISLKMSRSCLNDVLVMSLSFFGVVSVMSLSCLGRVWSSLGRVSVLSQWCLGRVWSSLGRVSVFFWWCLRVVLWLFGGVLGIFQWCVGHVSGMFRWSLHDVWWWCSDVLMMSGWRLGAVFCFGDGVFICLVFPCNFDFLRIWLHWQSQACAFVSCGMVHTSVENKYVGPTNKNQHIGSKFQARISPIFHSSYILIYLKQRGGREQTKRRNRALTQFTPATGSGVGRLVVSSLPDGL